MIRDTKNVPTPVFSPKRVESLTGSTEWVPGADDRVFMLAQAASVNFLMNSDATTWLLDPLVPIGIREGYTFTPDANCTILVE